VSCREEVHRGAARDGRGGDLILHDIGFFSWNHNVYVLYCGCFDTLCPCLSIYCRHKEKRASNSRSRKKGKNREGAHAILSRAFKRTHRSLSSCTCFHTAPFPCFLLAYSMLLLKTRVQLNAVLSFSLQKRTRFVTVPDEIIG
jgi:hypothetical protein